MNDPLMRCLRRLSFVPRWVIFPRLKDQSVAEHSFQVSCIALWLVQFHRDKNSPSFELAALKYGLVHDADESVTGDQPSPGKSPNYDRPQHEVLVKVADGLEAYAYLYEESMRGNDAFVAPVREDVIERVRPYWDLFEWDHGLGQKPSIGALLKMFRPTIFHPKYKHPVIEWMKEAEESDEDG